MTLNEWRQWQLPILKELSFQPSTLPVTVLIYHFWGKAETEMRFAETACSILQTWKCCGLLPTAIVTNATPPPSMQSFVARYPNVRIHENSEYLKPGSVTSMSYDCNANLASYFQTDYVLIVQNDGFPLQPGLDAFIGRHNYWGAPFIRPAGLKHIVDKFLNISVGNGGFSLRTRDICLAVNNRWKRWEKRIADCWLQEDTFSCLTLRLLSPSYARRLSLPNRKEAERFAYDELIAIPPPRELPFGVHGANSFKTLSRIFEHEMLSLFAKSRFDNFSAS